jgi:hypothetical protein
MFVTVAVVTMIVALAAAVIVVVVVFVGPVAFMQLPTLFVVIIVRMIPIGAFVRGLLPAPRHPLVMTALRGPVSIDPGVA